MAFGKGTGTQFPEGTKIYYAQIKTKDLAKPVFVISKKGDNGNTMEIVDPAADTITGDIIAIQARENKNPKKNNQIIKSVSVTLFDGKAKGGPEVVFLTISHSYLGRNILNSILGLVTYDGVSLNIYQGKPKPDKRNPLVMLPGFASSALRQAGQLVYGRFKNEELPLIPKVEFNGEKFGDTKAITDFFVLHVTELSKKLRASNGGSSAAIAEPSETPSGVVEEDGPPVELGPDGKPYLF